MTCSKDRTMFQRGRVLVTVLFLAALAGCGSPQTTGPGASGTYSFWPPMPDEPRLQFLTSYRYSSDVEPAQSGLNRLVFGTEQQILPIEKPYGVAMWQGRIYVCDIINPGIVILDLKSRQTRVMTSTGVNAMDQPSDIAIAPDGMKYVADRIKERIFVFNEQDQFVRAFGWEGFTPVGVAVHDDQLYAAEFEERHVVVLDRHQGTRLGIIGEGGGEEGQFIRPLGIATDTDGNVYVTDVLRGRLQKFGPDGRFIQAMGQIADSPGNFVRPKHVAVDRQGTIYVVDAAFQNVQMFSNEGEVLMFFGSAGSHDGSMSLPAGIAVHEADVELFADYIHPAFDAERLVVVTNQFGLNKVAVYALGGLRDGYTVEDIEADAGSVESGLADEPVDDQVLQPAGEVMQEGIEQSEP
jgi:DNA-binding beta-propeller fold protein YncE